MSRHCQHTNRHTICMCFVPAIVFRRIRSTISVGRVPSVHENDTRLRVVVGSEGKRKGRERVSAGKKKKTRTPGAWVIGGTEEGAGMG